MADAVPGNVQPSTISLYCDNEDGNLAVGYCQTCAEYLCKTCFDVHLVPKPSRNHVLLGENEMPMERGNVEDKTGSELDSAFEACEKHAQEVIKFYCAEHELFCCGSCVALEHRACGNVEYLLEVSGRFLKSKEYKDLETDIDTLLDNTGSFKSQIIEFAEKNETQSNQALATLEQFRETLNSNMDLLEEKTTMQIQKSNERNAEMVENSKSISDSIEKELKDIKDELSSFQTTKQYCHLFVAAKKASQSVRRLKSEYSVAVKSTEIENFYFKPDESLLATIQKFEAMGNFVINVNDESKKTAADKSRIPINRREQHLLGNKADSAVAKGSKQTARKTPRSTKQDKDPFAFRNFQTSGDIEISSLSEGNKVDSAVAKGSKPTDMKAPRSSKKDKDPFDSGASGNNEISSLSKGKKPWVTGIEDLDKNDGLTAIAVFNNQLIAVINMSDKAIVSQLKLPCGPWDVTTLQKDELIVTLPFRSTIAFIQVSGKEMKLTKQEKVSGDCHGITNDGIKLYVCYQNPGKLEIMKSDCTVLKTIDIDMQGQSIFVEPQYIAINKLLKLIYVSDWNANTLICLTTDGIVKDTFNDDSLKAPTGIATDQNGNVFVAGYHSNNVIQLSPTFKSMELSLDKRDKVVLPQALAFCGKSRSLYLGLRNSELLKVFKLK